MVKPLPSHRFVRVRALSQKLDFIREEGTLIVINILSSIPTTSLSSPWYHYHHHHYHHRVPLSSSSLSTLCTITIIITIITVYHYHHHHYHHCVSLPSSSLSSPWYHYHYHHHYHHRGTITIIITIITVYHYYHHHHQNHRFLSLFPGNYVLDFLDIQEKYYPRTIPVFIITDTNIKYENNDTQDAILKLSTIATQNPYYMNRTTSWMESFHSFASKASLSTVGANFMPSLKTFLNVPSYAYFNQDVILSEDNSSVVAARVLCYLKWSSISVRLKDGMLTLRKDLDDKAGIKAYASTKVNSQSINIVQYKIYPLDNCTFSAVHCSVVVR